jgi:dihydrofolate synthase/folylpolyglutamate synthase
MITQTEVLDYIEEIQSLQLDFKPSFFEITFVLALKQFLDQGCDYCIFETGMGGRLDATNVVLPVATAITNISLDHTAFLGNTLEAISKEKAGIIKANTPLFIGKKEGHSFPIFESISKKKNAILHINQNQYPFEGLPEYQKENFNLALNLFEFVSESKCHADILEKALQYLEQNTGYGKRLECIAEYPALYLDVSHNDEGIQRSIEYVKDQSKGKLFIILGGAKDKEYSDRTFEVLNQAQTSFCLFSNPRSKSKEDWEHKTRFFEKETSIFSNLGEAIERIRPLMAEEDTLLITGSFFLISDYKPSFW